MSSEPRSVRTTCPYCGVGCGVIATRDGAGAVAVAGDPAHPANLGRLCSKGAALAETLGLDGRLLHPELRGSVTTWDAALDAVAAGFGDVLRRHGPEAVAFYGSGQLLTEDYYVANKLMKGFIGSANMDTNSRLCMASAVAGHKRAFGSDTVPGCYDDFEQADLVVLVGSNLAFCHPVLHQRLVAAKAARPGLRVVLVDPRATSTAQAAELHLALRPGTDAMLFAGLLRNLERTGSRDRAFVAAHTAGLEAALAAVRDASPGQVARVCALPVEDVERFYGWFAETGRVVTAFSQGINQSAHGTDQVNAIVNCHLLTGRIGHPGQGPFSLTGQPNAMGGREVGGMANQLAAHLELENPEHRERLRRFWNAPNLATRPGLKAVELFQAIAAGRVKAVWIMATNPVVSLPDADAVAEALRRCPFVVVSDCVRETDTTALAHVRLPALTWGEKDGTVTNSERRVSRQRAFLPAPGQARPDWWIVTQVARRMGYASAFPYESAADVFREHCALSAFENGGQRDFDLGGLAGLTDGGYDALDPVQWPLRSPGLPGTARMFGDGRFYTPDGRARFVPVTPRMPPAALPGDPTLVLNTGRVRDHWHTLTRTGTSPRLSATASEPRAELHPRDAAAAGIVDGHLVRIVGAETGAGGAVLARATVTERQQPGSVFVPFHWNDRFAHGARVGVAIPPVTDPVSGQPAFKHARVRVRPFAAVWYGVVLCREELPDWPAAYRVRSLARGHRCVETAGDAPIADWGAWARGIAGEPDRARWIEYQDAAMGRYRGACLRDGRLWACVHIAPRPEELPDRAWLGSFFARHALAEDERRALLAGMPGAASAEGPTVCACFGVGERTLAAAIRDHGLTSVAQVGALLRAGTNCGSCVPDLTALLARHAQSKRAPQPRVAGAGGGGMTP